MSDERMADEASEHPPIAGSMSFDERCWKAALLLRWSSAPSYEAHGAQCCPDPSGATIADPERIALRQRG